MLTFQKATKRQARLRLALIGPAGSGKTFTALKLASYLGGRIALVDTEHGSASKYAAPEGADAQPELGQFVFDTLALDDFNPRTYIEAIHAAEEAGYAELILDSLSHAWAGKGGALELVDKLAKKSQSGNKFTAWADITPLQNELIDTILGARLNVIATLRSKTEYVLETNERGKQAPRKIGIGPVQRDGVDYEFDVVGELDVDNNLIVTKTRCNALMGQVITKPGQKLAETLHAWLSDGAPVYDREARMVRLREVREQLRAAGVTLDQLDPKAVRTMEQDKLERMITDFETLLSDRRK